MRARCVGIQASKPNAIRTASIANKAVPRSAEVLTLFHHAKDYGITADNITADYGAAIDRCLKIVNTQTRGVGFLMRKNKVDVVRGRGRLAGKDRVVVSGGADGDRELRAKNVIIATGSRVRPLPGVAIDGERIISAREIWGVKELPKKILIIGAGAIGLEFATVYSAYGVDVTVVSLAGHLSTRLRLAARQIALVQAPATTTALRSGA